MALRYSGKFGVIRSFVEEKIGLFLLLIKLSVKVSIPKIFEINPRISSTVMMRNKIGFKDCLWWVQSRLSLPLDNPKEVKVGTKIFRMSDEYVFTPG